jgi:hypothetical protein
LALKKNTKNCSKVNPQKFSNRAFGGGACVDTLSVTDTGSSLKSLFFYYIWMFYEVGNNYIHDFVNLIKRDFCSKHNFFCEGLTDLFNYCLFSLFFSGLAT